MRRIVSFLVGGSLVTGAACIVAADMPMAPAGITAVQQVTGSRGVVPRGSARPPVRRYRSYSIDPGTGGTVGSVLPGPVEAAPRFVPSSPSPSRPSKPSFMRGDAKARGQFHR